MPRVQSQNVRGVRISVRLPPSATGAPGGSTPCSMSGRSRPLAARPRLWSFRGSGFMGPATSVAARRPVLPAHTEAAAFARKLRY